MLLCKAHFTSALHATGFKLGAMREVVQRRDSFSAARRTEPAVPPVPVPAVVKAPEPEVNAAMATQEDWSHLFLNYVSDFESFLASNGLFCARTGPWTPSTWAAAAEHESSPHADGASTVASDEADGETTRLRAELAEALQRAKSAEAENARLTAQLEHDRRLLAVFSPSASR